MRVKEMFVVLVFKNPGVPRDCIKTRVLRNKLSVCVYTCFVVLCIPNFVSFNRRLYDYKMEIFFYFPVAL
jgi:hypothetical protein